ncbi:hypothetical protein LGR51_03655 [Pseudomonas sp. NP21570]|nr:MULTISPECIES: hypothetical protein [Stutzerimonas stutzeri subgroup]MCB4793602.1 hypothetical protein [Pseudomonas sp. NP21570]MCW8163001.1 hypothetical protein [Stutzerimonas stutzeri]
MPIAPQPKTYICHNCCWKQTVIPLSDVLRPGRDWFASCPTCGNGQLNSRPATRTEILRTRLEEFLR